MKSIYLPYQTLISGSWCLFASVTTSCAFGVAMQQLAVWQLVLVSAFVQVRSRAPWRTDRATLSAILLVLWLIVVDLGNRADLATILDTVGEYRLFLFLFVLLAPVITRALSIEHLLIPILVGSLMNMLGSLWTVFLPDVPVMQIVFGGKFQFHLLSVFILLSSCLIVSHMRWNVWPVFLVAMLLTAINLAFVGSRISLLVITVALSMALLCWCFIFTEWQVTLTALIVVLSLWVLLLNFSAAGQAFLASLDMYQSTGWSISSIAQRLHSWNSFF